MRASVRAYSAQREGGAISWPSLSSPTAHLRSLLMLADRYYMREKTAAPRAVSFTLWMLGVLAGVYVLQSILGTWFGSRFLENFGLLSADGVKAGHVWNIATHALLHGHLLHLLINAFGLFLLGRRLEAHYGAGKLGALAAACAIGGGALWLAFHFHDPGAVGGASGVLMGFLTVFVCLAPRAPLWPLPVPRYWMLVLFIGFDLIGLALQEFGHGERSASDLHSLHLGGALAGWVFYRLVLARRPARPTPAVEAPAWARRPAAKSRPAYTVNLEKPPARPAPASREAVRAEVDRILDKINLHGFASLTEQEKRTLDEARHQLNPR